MTRRDRRWFLTVLARERRRQRADVERLTAVVTASIVDLENQLTAARDQLRQIQAVDAFADTDRQWHELLH